MRRIVEPELLDSLPVDDRAAVRSRRDLARINALMGNAGILARALRSALPAPPATLIDLGAGDGRLTLALARRLAPHWPGLTVILVDRAPCVAPTTRESLERLGWRPRIVGADLAAWLQAAEAENAALVANLVLHHFDRAELARLLDLAARRAALIVACEPRRHRLAYLGSRLVGLIGCNAVTRHDAAASVKAGFAGREIAAAWRRPGWTLTERAAGWASHLFVAQRTTPE